VSNSYAEEIKTPQYGEGLDGLLRKRGKDLFGIINGISYEEFNPFTDIRIYRNYDIDSIQLKNENKYSLQEELGLPIGDMPVIGLISRLSGQKGLDLVIEKTDAIMKNNVQFVLLGTGDPYYESIFTEIKNRYPSKVAVFIGFNVVLAQKIYAGCDMFLMPSRFEPCGLGQIISLRYGTIPIVRAVGGLADTIVDYNEDEQNANGFCFKEFSSKAMYDAIERALLLYNNQPEKWLELKKKALVQDFSWVKSAEKYIELYNLAIRERKEVEAV
jgi:starch synthase